MSIKIGSHQLAAPARPKVKDPETERALREIVDKIRELQDLVRKLAA